MDSEIALNIIGQVLLAGRDNTPLGENEEKDFRNFHKSLQYFHLVWLEEEIMKICQKHKTKTEFLINDYFQALKKLERSDKKIYKLFCDDSIKNFRELIIHTIPEIHIIVDGTRKQPHLLITDGHHIVVHNSNADLYPSELLSLFSGIDTKLKERSKDIIISGLKDIVPDSLKSYFLRGKFTKDMGCCMNSDGSYSIGHEIRLSATETHDMVYAYIPDYFWQEQSRIRTFENVVYSYWALSEISARLPKDVDFICQHRDDCGVYLTNETPSQYPSIDRDEFLRRKAVLMVRKEQNSRSTQKQKQRNYEYIMDYCCLNERYSMQEFLRMCNSDIIKLQNLTQIIKSRLGVYAEEVTIVFNTNSISIFFMKNREQHWTRECYLQLPYHTNLNFLKDIGVFMEKSKELVSVFDKSWDIETTVGLLAKWNS